MNPLTRPAIKRIIAKEFLVLVGCIVVMLLVALYSWGHNSRLHHQMVNAGRQYHEQRLVLDSLIAHSTSSGEGDRAVSAQVAVIDKLMMEQNVASRDLWSKAKQWAVVKWVAIVLLVLVYPLRLLVLGTSWALRVLRT